MVLLIRFFRLYYYLSSADVVFFHTSVIRMIHFASSGFSHNILFVFKLGDGVMLKYILQVKK